MKKRFLARLLFVVLLTTFLLSCANGVVVKKTEIGVTTYESAGALLRSTYVYLSTREANGSLVGDELLKAKSAYGLARTKYLEAGTMMQNAITTPSAFDMTKYQALLDEVARIAASLSVKGGQ